MSMGQDIRYHTIMLFTGIIAVVMVSSLVLATGQEYQVKVFILLLNTLLVSVNVIGFFLIRGATSSLIDEVFVMTPSGMLLKHYTRRLKPDRDEHILAGMLTAVQNFIKDSFEGVGGQLKEIRFEDYDILISNSDNIVLAAVISTRNPQKLRGMLKNATEEIERIYGHRLKDWSGDISELKHIDNIMKRILGRA